jgi:hypothetical protein
MGGARYDLVGHSGGGGVLDNNEHQWWQHDTWMMGLAAGLGVGLAAVSRVTLLAEPFCFFF